MKRWLNKNCKSILAAFLTVVFLCAFFNWPICVYQSALQTTEDILWNEALMHNVYTLLLFAFVVFAILAVRFLYESLHREFFSSVVSILAAVVLSGEILNIVLKYFGEVYEVIWQRLLLAASLILFGCLAALWLGTYPMSARMLIRSMQRKLKYHEMSDRNWIQKSGSYTVEVVRMDTIPQNDSQNHGTSTTDIDKALRKFLKCPFSDNEQNRMILIGGYGVGKSTALINAVQDRLRHPSLRHTGTVPIYISLREWLAGDDDVREGINTSGEAYLNQKKTVEEKEEEKAQKTQKKIRDILTERLFDIVTASSEMDKDKAVMTDVLLKLHEQRKLVYVFDGLNELLQTDGVQDDDSKSQQRTRNIAAFLYAFASGNRCIISLCTLPRVITTKSILQGDAEKYLVYMVKGVRLEDSKARALAEDQKSKWMENLFPCVALYRLADSRKKEKPEGGKISNYKLLEGYITSQIGAKLIDDTQEEQCFKAVHNAINQSIKAREPKKTVETDAKEKTENQQNDNEQKEQKITTTNDTHVQLIGTEKPKCSDPVSAFLHSPYSGLTAKDNQGEFRSLCNACLFYEKSTESEVRYYPAHILLYEYFLTSYVKKIYFTDETQNEISFAEFFCGKSKTTKGDKTPNLLELPHLRAVFKMLVTEILGENDQEENDQEKTPYLLGQLEGIIDWINNNNKIEENNKDDELAQKRIKTAFLMLLSEINDETYDLFGKEIVKEQLLSGENAKEITNLIKALADDKGLLLSQRFALAKLISDSDEQKKTISSLLLIALERDEWMYLSLQREIIAYLQNIFNCNVSEQCVGTDAGYATYLMHEYPARLLRKGAKNQEAKGFKRKRIRNIQITTMMYLLLVVFLLCQELCAVWLVATGKDGALLWPIVILKAIGLVLWGSSFHAWRKQLWKDEEYYGFALGNYSKDVPIDHVLKNRHMDVAGRMIVGDWLKNRPSIIYLLVVSISGIYLLQLIEEVFSVQIGPYGTLVQAVICILLFLFSFPGRMDDQFISLLKKKQKNEGKEQKDGKGETGFVSEVTMLTLLFLFLFELPLGITVLIESEWIVLLVSVAVGIMVFLALLLITVWKKHNDSKEDKRIINELKPQSKDDSRSGMDDQGKGARTKHKPCIWPDSFEQLSCKGQMQLLNRIQSKELDCLPDAVKQLEPHAHTPQILDAIMNICSMN